MADAKQVSLYNGGAVTLDGDGGAVDIGELHSLLRGAVFVTSVTGTGPAIDFFIETSSDGSTAWIEKYSFEATGTGKYEFVVDELDRYVRLRWALSGFTASTFSCSAESHVLYATRRDLNLKVLDEVITSSTDVMALAEILLSATSEAEDALNAQYSLPISTWPDSLRYRCAQIAKYKFFDRDGFAPKGVDELIVKNYDDAEKWLEKVACRKIVLSGVAESAIVPIVAVSGNANKPDPAPRFSDNWGDFG